MTNLFHNNYAPLLPRWRTPGTDRAGPSDSSSSRTGRSRGCPSQARDSSTSSGRSTRPRSSSDRRGRYPCTAGERVSWLAGWVASQLTIKTLHRVASNLALQPRCALHCTALGKTYSLSNLSRDIIASCGMRKSSEPVVTNSSFYLFTYLWSAVRFILSKFYFIFWNSC